MVLINAVYFRGTWKKRFFGRKNLQNSFLYIGPKSNPFADIKCLDSKAISLPYAKGLSMLIIIPNQRMGLDDLEAKLRSTNLTENAKQFLEVEVNLSLPTFKIQFQVELLPILKKLGMSRMCTELAEFVFRMSFIKHVWR